MRYGDLVRHIETNRSGVVIESILSMPVVRVRFADDTEMNIHEEQLELNLIGVDDEAK